MLTRTALILTAAALSAGAASAQETNLALRPDSALLFATPNALNASVRFAAQGPLSFDLGAFTTFTGDVGFFGAVNHIHTIPVAQTFPVNITPYLGASLATVVNLPLSASLGALAYLGAVFPVSQNYSLYVQSGPSFQLLPDRGVTWSGATQLGAIFTFDY